MWRDHALAAWRTLESDAIVERRGRAHVLADSDAGDASLWPLVHVLWAAADVMCSSAPAPIGRLGEILDRHRAGEAYRATPRDRSRYFDDNAWLGLASLRVAEA